MMLRRAICARAKLDYARPDRTGTQYDRARLRSATGCSSVDAADDRRHRLRARGRADRDVYPGYGGIQFGGWIFAQALARPRPFDAAGACGTGCGGSTGCSRSRSSQHPVHEGRAHAVELRPAWSLRDRWPASGCARSSPSPRLARRRRRARRLQPATLLQLDADSAAAATSGPAMPPVARCRGATSSLSFASRPPGDSASVSAACSVVSTASASGHGLCSERARRGRRARRDDLVVHAVQCMRQICPVGIEQAPIINQLRRRLGRGGRRDPNSGRRRSK